MAEVLREHGPNAANQLISDMRMDEMFGFTIAPASPQKIASSAPAL
jgi:hypothetical protein